MPFKPPQNDAAAYCVVLLITALGGVARVAYNAVTGVPTSLWSAVCQIIISAFTSALMLLLAIRFQWQFEGTAIACGLGSWSGVSIVKTLEQRLISRLSHPYK